MKVLKYIITFIILTITFNLLLYLCALIPSDYLYDNALKSSEILVLEGNLYQLGPFYKIDNETDSLIINEAISIDSKDPFKSYMTARKNYREGITKVSLDDTQGALVSYRQNKYDEQGTPIVDDYYDAVVELREFAKGKVTTSVNYARYYHGYLTIIRPLLLLFDVLQIRIFLLVISIILLILLIKQIYKKVGRNEAGIVLISLLMYGYFYAFYSLQQVLAYMVMIIVSILLLKYIEKLDLNKIFYIFFIVGMVTNFVDYLTTPILTVVFPLFLLIIAKKDISKELTIKNIVLIILLWGLGYVFTWISKWILYAIFFDDNYLSTIINQITFRSYADDSKLMETLDGDISICFNLFIITLLIYAIPLLLNSRIFISKKPKKLFFDNKEAFFIAFVPLLWGFATFSHFRLHIIFTYRNFMVITMLILYIIHQKIDYKSPKIK